MTPTQVAAATGGSLLPGTPAGPDAPTVTGAVIDSRLAGPGTLFVGVPGEHADGADYAPAAVAAGAPFVLVGHPVGAPGVLVPDAVAALGALARTTLAGLRQGQEPPAVLAITGSVGKTTAKDLLGRIMAAQGNTVVPAGSFNNHLGLPLTVLRADQATRYLVLEMGANHVGEIAALTVIAPPDVAVVLGVTAAHLGEFGSIEAIAATKAELVQGLAAGGMAVLNADDPLVMAMAAQAAGKVVTFGLGPGADFRAEDITTGPGGYLALTIAGQPLQTQLVGEHLAINVAAAVAAAATAGVDPAKAVQALRGAGPASPGRMVVKPLSAGATLVDDSYNANPASVEGALRATAAMAKAAGHEAWAVLSEMLELGEAAPELHRAVGQLVAELGYARLFVVGEGARPVLSGAAGAGMAPGAVEFWPEAEGLAAYLAGALAQAAGQEHIVIKGSHGTGLWRVAGQLADLAGEGNA
ncbi:MAG: UDP-N-acetylmuramoyl-tripeptide--D-alanyl-D-alanine ligase [Bifidobacteriaceae bacterium]|jgi:UDP-N-acetylmuramoyl-tripeptide--D-alanyl-D-alanine ligase|nr:UDP-N-acetylmuramoyl-tripeptide--D-alanyl-D-alanine ligase [Bifidobacteriaceae bacterium]